MRTSAPVKTLLAVTTAAVCGILAVPASANRTQTLAQGPVAVPPGGSFVSVVEFPQPPGAKLGPHGHFPGFVYVLGGEASIVEEGTTRTLNPGEGDFIAALAVHTHENADNRLPAGALAGGLVLVVVILVLAARSPRTRVVLLPVLLAALIAGGAIALWDPWKNDWFFLSVRPESTRGAPMPIPSAKDTYASAPLSNVPPGPYVASLATTTVDPHGQMALSKAAGPIAFLVLDGSADVTIDNGGPARLDDREGTLVQAGETLRIVNPSGTVLRLLRFGLTPKSSSP